MKTGSSRITRLAGLGLVLAASGTFAQAPNPGPTRGELLYGTHCIACHREQMHWRDKREAVDWPTLKQQVALWQARALLGWGDDDITEVARFLNDTIYRYPVDSGPRAQAPAAFALRR